MGASSRINDFLAGVLLLLLAVSPLPLGSNRPVYWALAATVVFAVMAVFLVRAGRRQKVRLGGRALQCCGLLVAVYLGYMAVQVAAGISVAPRATVLAIVRTLSYAVFFYLLVQLAANRGRRGWMLAAVFWIVAGYGLFGFLQLFGEVSLPDSFGLLRDPENARGTFVNRNSFATYLGFGLLSGLAVMGQRVRHLRKRAGGAGVGMVVFADGKLVLVAIAEVLLLVTLIATNSRMGTAAVLVAAGFFLLVAGMKRVRMAAGGIAGAAAGILGLSVLALYLYGARLLERLGSVEQDADVRFALYRQVWDMVRERLWTGWGADSFPVAFQGVHRLPVSADLVWDKAHNTYLTNWAEAGVLFGSIPLLAGLMLFGWFFGKLLKRRQRFVLPLLGASVLLQGALHSLADFSLEIQANMFLLLAILALAAADAITEKAAPDV